MKKLALFLKHNRTKLYYAVVTTLLLLLFSWSIFAAAFMLQGDFQNAPTVWQWGTCTLIGVGDLVILIWQYVRMRQAESLTRLIHDMQQIASDNSDRLIDWQAMYAPKTQALIDVTNTIAKKSVKVNAQKTK